MRTTSQCRLMFGGLVLVAIMGISASVCSAQGIGNSAVLYKQWKDDQNRVATCQVNVSADRPFYHYQKQNGEHIDSVLIFQGDTEVDVTLQYDLPEGWSPAKYLTIYFGMLEESLLEGEDTITFTIESDWMGGEIRGEVESWDGTTIDSGAASCDRAVPKVLIRSPWGPTVGRDGSTKDEVFPPSDLDSSTNIFATEFAVHVFAASSEDPLIQADCEGVEVAIAMGGWVSDPDSFVFKSNWVETDSSGMAIIAPAVAPRAEIATVNFDTHYFLKDLRFRLDLQAGFPQESDSYDVKQWLFPDKANETRVIKAMLETPNGDPYANRDIEVWGGAIPWHESPMKQRTDSYGMATFYMAGLSEPAQFFQLILPPVVDVQGFVVQTIDNSFGIVFGEPTYVAASIVTNVNSTGYLSPSAL